MKFSVGGPRKKSGEALRHSTDAVSTIASFSPTSFFLSIENMRQNKKIRSIAWIFFRNSWHRNSLRRCFRNEAKLSFQSSSFFFFSPDLPVLREPRFFLSFFFFYSVGFLIFISSIGICIPEAGTGRLSDRTGSSLAGATTGEKNKPFVVVCPIPNGSYRNINISKLEYNTKFNRKLFFFFVIPDVGYR